MPRPAAGCARTSSRSRAARRPAAVGIHRRGLVRAGSDRGRGAPHRRSRPARTRPTSGGIGLVLGAGNVTSIPVLDVLYELLAQQPRRAAQAQPDAGRAAAGLRAGARAAHRAGLRPDRPRRRRRRRVPHRATPASPTSTSPAPPRRSTRSCGVLDGPDAARDRSAQAREPPAARRSRSPPSWAASRRSSSCPGVWTDADLRFQAEHIATMRLQNSGHNCIAGQVVLLSADWPQRDAFLAALRTAYDAAPRVRPGTRAATRSSRPRHPTIPTRRGARRAPARSSRSAADDDATALETTEYFAPVLGVVVAAGQRAGVPRRAPSRTPTTGSTGTLGANVLIDPATQAALGDGFEQCDRRPALRLDRDQRVDGLRVPHSDADLGRLPRRDARRTSRAASASCTTRCCSTASSDPSRAGPFRPFPAFRGHPRS